MSVSRTFIALSIVALCAVALILPASPALAQAPQAPEDLMVMPWGPQELLLQWSEGCCSDPVRFFVYRNGQLVTPGGIPDTDPLEYLDVGLAPDTPHTYTVQAENTGSGERSPMSVRAAEMTMEGMVIRVPFEAPTIQDAILIATNGTTILVAPGIYDGSFIDLLGRSGITIKGQDPEGVVLEMFGGGGIDLDPNPGTNITLSGVTISGGQVLMGQGDTVSNCVFVMSPIEAVSGGGFVTNSVFDYGPMPVITVLPGEFIMVANSIFMDGGGAFSDMPPNGFLLNNNFVSGIAPPDIPGESEGNYSDYPCFEDPGPPQEPDPYWYPSFLPCPGPDQDAGAFVGLYVPDMMPDVGAFELYEPYTPQPYTPQPPSDLTAVWEGGPMAPPGIVLSWTPSPDDPSNPEPPPIPTVMEYIVYRSDSPDMSYPMEWVVPAGENTFFDPEPYPGNPTPFFYQVRASMGPPMMDPWPIVSRPTDTLTTDAPANLRLLSVTNSSVDFAWDPPMFTGPLPPMYNVYRNGRLITPSPIYGDMYTDTGLAAETPHTYTVQAVPECLDPPMCTMAPPPGERFTSMQSDHLGAMTGVGIEVRVPQDHPTIQAAIDAAGPGTSIHVGPGVYQEDIYLPAGVAVVGQDPQGAILDLSGTTSQAVDLDPAPGTNSTISGFTIVGGGVYMGEGDTVANCVFRDSPWVSVSGGGFVTNSVFDGSYSSPWPSPPIVVPPHEFMTVANSVFLGGDVFSFTDPETIYLLHNSFDTPEWMYLPGKGNFDDIPMFRPPGPPDTYVVEWSQGIDNGIDVGLYVPDMMPDVGAFELGLPYTPEPPSNLAAVWNGVAGAVDLSWTESPDDPIVNPGTLNPIMEYLIYRAEAPELLPNQDPMMSVPAGTVDYQDFSVLPGNTYYYQVRANSGGPPPTDEILSQPSNTASSETNNPPVAVDDSYSVNKNYMMVVGPPGVLLNDSDAEGDPLTAVLVSGVTNGMLILHPLGDFDYTPNFGFSGTDTFTYVANDGTADSNVATVTITVVNQPPVANDDSYSVNSNDTLFVDAPGVLQNDTDPDEGDFLVAFLVSDVTNGTLTLATGGNFDYTPNPGFTGTDSFTYYAYDGTNISSWATVTITVNGTTAPIADDQSVTTGRDLPVAITLTASDADGDPLTYSVVSPPVNGSLSGTAPNLTYTPHTGGWGVDTLTFVANDGTSDSNVATVTITVTGPPWTINTRVNGETYINIEAGTPVHLTADFTDVGGGDHVIAEAEYFLDTIGADGTGTAMSAADGSFDSPNEGVEAFIDTSGWSGGGHLLYVHAYDGTDGWGPIRGRTVYIKTMLQVDSITMTTSTAKQMTSASATVQILDHLASPIAGAMVSGHWEGLTADTEIPTATAVDGTVTFNSDEVRKASGTFTFVVDDVSKEFDGTYEYAYNASVPPPSGSIDYPPAPVCTDNDNDQYSVEGGDCGEADCEDADPDVNPGADEICGDGKDNDCNGLTDDDDPVCGGSVCTAYTKKDNCTDDLSCEWVGNPNNGHCQDAEQCEVTESPETSCSDGIDNDCDSEIDLDDSDCSGSCEPDGREKGKKCSDGIDNDCDGLVDSADPECGD